MPHINSCYFHYLLPSFFAKMLEEMFSHFWNHAVQSTPLILASEIWTQLIPRIIRSQWHRTTSFRIQVKNLEWEKVLGNQNIFYISCKTSHAKFLIHNRWGKEFKLLTVVKFRREQFVRFMQNKGVLRGLSVCVWGHDGTH